jgi:hypothetical protein
MQHLKTRAIVILLGGITAVALSLGSVVNTQAEPVSKPLRQDQPAPVAAQIPAAKTEGFANSPSNESNSLQLAANPRYARAALLFPRFCQEWEEKLHDREVNNRAHIHWDIRNGSRVGNYVGYSTVQSCECKQSPNGLPIGKLTYQEFNYNVSGKTVDEARRATPSVTHTTNTLEIFSWDRNRWFY